MAKTKSKPDTEDNDSTLSEQEAYEQELADHNWLAAQAARDGIQVGETTYPPELNEDGSLAEDEDDDEEDDDDGEEYGDSEVNASKLEDWDNLITNDTRGFNPELHPREHGKFARKGEGEEHGKHDAEHGHHPAHHVEHLGHTAHSAEEGHHIGHILAGGHADAHQAIHAAEHAATRTELTEEAGHVAGEHAGHGAEALAHDVQVGHSAHTAHEAGHHGDMGDVYAITSRMLLPHAIKAVVHILSKHPKTQRAARGITKVAGAINAAAERYVKHMQDTFGHGTAALVLGSGALLHMHVKGMAGIAGPTAHAIPGPALIGSLPLYGIAMAGHAVGLVKPGNRLDRHVSTVGTWIQAIHHGLGAIKQEVGKTGLKAARAMGKIATKVKQFVVHADPLVQLQANLALNTDLTTPPPEVIDALAEMLYRHVEAAARQAVQDHWDELHGDQGEEEAPSHEPS